MESTLNARSLTAVAAAALLSPLAASAGVNGQISIGTAYEFNLQPVDQEFVNSAFQYNDVDAYFVGFQSLSLAGFTAATGLSIDRLESVQLRFEGETVSEGSGGAFVNSSATIPDTKFNLNSLELFSTETDPNLDSGFRSPGWGSTGFLSESPHVDLSFFAADTIEIGVFTNVAFYGALNQAAEGFTSSGFATLDYFYTPEPSVAANAIVSAPTPSAALAGLFGLAGVALRRRKAAIAD